MNRRIAKKHKLINTVYSLYRNPKLELLREHKITYMRSVKKRTKSVRNLKNIKWKTNDEFAIKFNAQFMLNPSCQGGLCKAKVHKNDVVDAIQCALPVYKDNIEVGTTDMTTEEIETKDKFYDRFDAVMMHLEVDNEKGGR